MNEGGFVPRNLRRWHGIGLCIAFVAIPVALYVGSYFALSQPISYRYFDGNWRLISEDNPRFASAGGRLS